MEKQKLVNNYLSFGLFLVWLVFFIILDNSLNYEYILGEVKIMKKITCILFGCVFATFLWSANPMNLNTTISWYGQGSLLSNQEFSDNQLDDEDTLDRKRRHRRRRKIRPPKKGW